MNSKAVVVIIFTIYLNYCNGVESELWSDYLRNTFLKLEHEQWSLLLNGPNSDFQNNTVTKFHDFFKELSNNQFLFSEEKFTMDYTDLIVLQLQNQLNTFDARMVKLNNENANLERWKDSLTDQILFYDKLENHMIRLHSRKYQVFNGYDKTSCDRQTSYDIEMYIYYNKFMDTYLRAYSMTQFSYILLAYHTSELSEYYNISLILREKFKKQITELYFIYTSHHYKSEKWRCDPKYFEEGVNYDQITNFLQLHIENEVDINSKRSCRATCNDYKLTQNHGCYDSSSSYCQNRKTCKGKILNCKYMSSDADVCISRSRNRRFDFVTLNTKRFGKKTDCWQTSANSWRRWFVRCDYCMCFCDEQGPNSDRYFSLREVKSNVQENRVITGLRIIKVKRIFHFQIQEGTLLPYGFIDQNSVRWVPVDSFRITDRGVYNERDFHTITFDQRTIELKKQELPPSHWVLTGIKFHLTHYDRLVVKITGNKIDFQKGIVTNSTSTGFGSGSGYPLSLENLDVPIFTVFSSPIRNNVNEIEFTHTGLEEDAAQTAIPFIDIQEVTSSPAVPLNGMAIRYKGEEPYGGFITPEINTFNYKIYASDKFSLFPKITNINSITVDDE